MAPLNRTYHDLTSRARKRFLDCLAALESGGDIPLDGARLLARPLDFAEGWELVSIENHAVYPHIRRLYLWNRADRIRPPLYTSEPEQAVFQDMSLNIHANSVIDYLTLYFHYYIRGGEKIRPVFHADDIAWRSDLTSLMRKSIEKELSRYPAIEDGANDYGVSLPVLFRRSLGILDARVDVAGAVTIGDFTVLVDDLPAQDADPFS